MKLNPEKLGNRMALSGTRSDWPRYIRGNKGKKLYPFVFSINSLKKYNDLDEVIRKKLY